MKKLLSKKGAFVALAALFVVFTVLFVWCVASPVSVIGTYKISSTENNVTVEGTYKIKSSNKYVISAKSYDKDGKEISSSEKECWYFVDEGKLVTLSLLAKDATNEDYKKAVEAAKESLTYEATLKLSPSVKLGKIEYDEELSYKNAAIVVVTVLLAVLDAVVLALAVLSLLYLLKGDKKSAKKKTAKAKK